MAKESITIKGTKEGITVVLDTNDDFEDVKNAISEKLKSCRGFFSGGKANLKVKDGSLNKDEFYKLKKLFMDYGMSLQEASSPKTFIFPKPHRNRVLLLKRTVRSGQKIVYKGTIVILGDANPGSELVATGDILVMGALRGMAHAGADGDFSAMVAAFRLQPTQLRIANVISRSPEEKEDVPQIPEIARLRGKAIVIEPYHNLNNDGLKRRQEGIR